MKRMMMMSVVAAVFAAGSVQAASIVWGTGNISTIPGVVNAGQTWATDLQGRTMTFFVVGSGFDLAGYTTALAAGNDVSAYTAQMTVSGTGNLASSAKGNASATSANIYAASTTYYGFARVSNAFADMVGAGTVDYLISSSLWSGTVAANGANLNAGLALNFRTVDVVPEPTSMALLALGAAALGLRRKFRK